MKAKLLVAAMAVAALTMSASAQKGAKATSRVTSVDYPAEITFWNRATDGVTSDGATYKNGVSGLKVVFQDMSDGTGTKNFLLNMARSRGRTLNFDYRTEVATSCQDPESDGPLGTLGDGSASFWILNALSMPVGSTIAKQGAFATAIGNFRFHDETKINPQEPYYCSQLMVVTRVSQTHWTVTTDVDPYLTYFNTAGLVVTPGSTAQLDRDTLLRGNYKMAFGADIICPTCK